MTKKKTKLSTLYDLTGQEAGIVIYRDGDIDRVFALNWAQNCPHGGLPVSLEGVLIGWPGDYYVIGKKDVDDVRAEFRDVVIDDNGDICAENMDVVYDDYGDIPALWGIKIDNATINTDDSGNFIPTGGTVYALTDNDDNDITVVAPEGWN